MTNESDSRTIGVTMGDPSGVGPELCAALIAEGEARDLERTVFFADRVVLERAFTQLTGRRLPDTTRVVDRGLLGADQAVPGQPTEAGAKAQVGYLEAAARSARRRELAAIVTAPVSKAQCRRVGFEFPGQTEFLAGRLDAEHSAMLFAAPAVNVVLATSHVPLKDVPETLSAERLDEVLDTGIRAMQSDFAIAHPRVGVVALNPHAGEAGLLGGEERAVIAPAIARAAQRWSNAASVVGPLIPDHAFRPPSLERFDLLVAMYHDQALIPLKLLDFDRTVNVTVGLPVVRTSPDHGVAYDIAGKGTVRTGSFMTAVELAGRIVERRLALAAADPP